MKSLFSKFWTEKDGNTENSSFNFEKFQVLNPDVRIVHISDTHNLHDQLVLPEADILIHTGDFSDDGTKEEFEAFNNWLGKINRKPGSSKPRYPLGIFVVLGNHDYKFLNEIVVTQENDNYEEQQELIETMSSDMKRKEYMHSLLSNATQVLDNEAVEIHIVKNANSDTDANNAKLLKLTLFGSPWNPFQYSPTRPDRVKHDLTLHDAIFQRWSAGLPAEKKISWTAGQAHRYDEIPGPGEIDLLLTHVPPFGIFDKMPVFKNWGSSVSLLKNIQRKKPRAVLFGHVHAQRGYWEKITVQTEAIEVIRGGAEYAQSTNTNFITDPMMKNIQFAANSALLSDRTVTLFGKRKIVGKPRVILGMWCTEIGWHFHDT